jgi:hypothetical protein
MTGACITVTVTIVIITVMLLTASAGTRTLTSSQPDLDLGDPQRISGRTAPAPPRRCLHIPNTNPAICARGRSQPPRAVDCGTQPLVRVAVAP